MTLSEIAAGIEVTAEQRERGVATVDETTAPLEERLEPFAEQLPCVPSEAAKIVEAYGSGADVSRAAAVAEVPKTTAAKTLYLLGEPIDPLPATAKRLLDDWLAGDVSRTEAQRLAAVGTAEFALGAYIATHDPIPGADCITADALSVDRTSDPLSETRSSVQDLL